MLVFFKMPPLLGKFQYSADTACWDHVSGWDLCSFLTFLFPAVAAEGDLESPCPTPQGQSLQAALQLPAASE